MKKRSIPVKNYFILAIVCLVSVLFVWYCVSWYRTTEEYRAESSAIVELVSEINMDEVNNYVLDNGNITLYIASFKENPNLEFEKDLKKLILEYDLSDSMVVLNKDDVNDPDFFQNITNQFLSEEWKQKNVNISYTPNLLVFENGKIIDIYNTADQITSYDKLEAFLVQHQAVEEQ